MIEGPLRTQPTTIDRRTAILEHIHDAMFLIEVQGTERKILRETCLCDMFTLAYSGLRNKRGSKILIIIQNTW